MSKRIEGRAMFIKSTSLMKNQESYVDANILCPMYHCKRKTFNSVYSFPDPKLTWICVGSALNWLIFFSIKTLLIRDILCYLTLREKFPNTDFFWSVFSCIRTKYGKIRGISPYSFLMRENTDQRKFRISTQNICFRYVRISQWVFRICVVHDKSRITLVLSNQLCRRQLGCDVGTNE